MSAKGAVANLGPAEVALTLQGQAYVLTLVITCNVGRNAEESSRDRLITQRAIAELTNRIQGRPAQAIAVDLDAGEVLAEEVAKARKRVAEMSDKVLHKATKQS